MKYQDPSAQEGGWELLPQGGRDHRDQVQTGSADCCGRPGAETRETQPVRLQNVFILKECVGSRDT